MLIVQKGWITHNGVTYGRGQALPKMAKKEELRLLDLGVCIEGNIPRFEKVMQQEDESHDGEEVATQAEGEGVNLSFDPGEAIKSKSKKG